ncbi:hypothetical protein X777_04962 [Ooceraea biroi]|uniref:Uncharacterized protein n=1 Tax=Ooceraea biroi TaxID=2015173 RepID=A0A026WF56_OOCBI|nr:hypothetical protein X777_04962 [Ooceraea biroi]
MNLCLVISKIYFLPHLYHYNNLMSVERNAERRMQRQYGDRERREDARTQDIKEPRTHIPPVVEEFSSTA